MNCWARLGPAAVIAVLLVGLLSACGSGDDEGVDAAGATQSTSETLGETSTQSTTEQATTETTESEPATTNEVEELRRVIVTVRDGQPVGGVLRVEIEQDAQVLLIVRSDVEDEAHLHGYDLAAKVAPGHPARIRFRANQVGSFELELEERAVPIAELEVHA